jgi:nicotinate-nucleotide adenylyltransferase
MPKILWEDNHLIAAFKQSGQTVQPEPNKPASLEEEVKAYLKEKYPTNEFALIMGEDNLRTLHKWLNHEVLLKNHQVYVYPRVLTLQEEAEVVEIGTETTNAYAQHPSVILCDDGVVQRGGVYRLI